MKDRRPAPAPWRNTKSWMQSLFGLGLAASLAPDDVSARKNNRDGDKKSEEDSENKRSRDDENTESSNRATSRGESDQKQADRKSEKSSDEQDPEKSGNNKDKSDDSASGKESKQSQKESDDTAKADDDSSRNKDRKESKNDDTGRNSDDTAESTVEDESTQQLSRREARRQAKQASSDESEGDDSGGGGKHRSRDLEQAANTEDVVDESDAELAAADDAPATTTPAHIGIAQTNPNVDLDDVPVVDDIPALDDAELIVQGNANVIAAVSTNGGFAFARSGDMTVVSGPDGPRIIQGEIAEVTVPADDVPADDGGNNDVEFSS